MPRRPYIEDEDGSPPRGHTPIEDESTPQRHTSFKDDPSPQSDTSVENSPLPIRRSSIENSSSPRKRISIEEVSIPQTRASIEDDYPLRTRSGTANSSSSQSLFSIEEISTPQRRASIEGDAPQRPRDPTEHDDHLRVVRHNTENTSSPRRRSSTGFHVVRGPRRSTFENRNSESAIPSREDRFRSGKARSRSLLDSEDEWRDSNSDTVSEHIFRVSRAQTRRGERPRSYRGNRYLVFPRSLRLKDSNTPFKQSNLAVGTFEGPGSEMKASSHRSQDLNILAATSYSDKQDDGFVELKGTREPVGGESGFIRWRHIQSQFMDLAKFQRMVEEDPHISQNMSLVITRLMANVRDELLRSTPNGHYLLSTSIRGDAEDPAKKDKVDYTATWLSFSYFSVEDEIHDRTELKHSVPPYPLRTLLQSYYDNQSTKARDSSQCLRKCASSTTNKLVYVPQVWMLFAGNDTIISYSRATLDDLLSPTITQKTVTIAGGPEVLKVVDPHSRLFFFAVKDCVPLSLFKDLVSSTCLKDMNCNVDNDCCITAGDLTISDDQTWFGLLETAKTSILTVNVSKAQDNRDKAITVHGLDRGLLRIENNIRRQRVLDLSKDGLIVNNTSSVPSNYNPEMYRLSLNVPNTPLQLRGFAHDHGAKSKPGTSGKTSSLQEPSKQPRKEQHDHHVEKPSDGSLRTEDLSKDVLKDIHPVPQDNEVELPFLKWKLRGPATEGSHLQPKQEDSDLKRMHQILSTLDSKIRNPKYKLVDDPYYYDFLGEYNNAQFYQETSSMTFKQLNDLMVHNGYTSSHLQKPTASHRTDTSNDDPVSNTDRSSAKAHYNHQNNYAKIQRDEMHKILEFLVPTAMKLISLFVQPPSYPDQLLSKVWGALVDLTKTGLIDDVSSSDGQTDSKDQRESPTWVIRPMHHKQATALAGEGLPYPREPFESCGYCASGIEYHSYSAAMEHLLENHFRAYRSSHYDTTAVSFWVRTTRQGLQEKRNAIRILFLDLCKTNISKIFDKALAISKVVIHSTKTEGLQKPDHALPASLAHAFEQTVVFLMAANRTLQLINQRLAYVTIGKSSEAETKINKYLECINYLGYETQKSIAYALKDVVLLIRTDAETNTVNCAAVGSHFLGLVVCKNLYMSPLYEGKRVRELYEGFTSTLQYKAYHKPPGKRLIGEVQTLQEEISACLKVLQGQEEFAADFKAVLSPRSFRISTSFQSLQYREFIKPAANALLKDIRDERKKLMHLMGRLNMIEQKARYRIELLEEDNSKAIFIFTLVTVIFLPLSFVTSYMGMNTADIRDTNKTQGTFWAAALPTTVVVLSVTMLLAYNASAIREWLFDARLEWSEHRQRPRRGHAGRVSFGSLHFASWRGGRKRDDGDPGAGPV